VEPGLARAHALFDCDMTDEAGAEWALVVGTAKSATKIQAAHLASRWGWYAQTIATLAQAGEWDDVPLRYPRPYAAAVANATKETQVPDDWLFAIMRQESLFRKDAVSRADARGLMQMQPATAAAVAVDGTCRRRPRQPVRAFRGIEARRPLRTGTPGQIPGTARSEPGSVQCRADVGVALVAE